VNVVDGLKGGQDFGAAKELIHTDAGCLLIVTGDPVSGSSLVSLKFFLFESVHILVD